MHLEQLSLAWFGYLLLINRYVFFLVHFVLKRRLLSADLVQRVQFLGIGDWRLSPVLRKNGISLSAFFSAANGLKSGLNAMVGATISSKGFGVIKCSMLFSWSKSRLGVMLYLPNERLTAERMMAYIDFSSWYFISVFVG